MTFGPNGQWFDSLPSCETQVPCGEGRHPVRWEGGSLLLPEHPDVEGELVLAALGGEKAGCVEVAEAWQRHGADLSVLAIGPRHPADEIVVGWDDVAAARPGPVGLPGAPRPGGSAGLAQHGPMRRPGARPASMAALSGRRQQMQAELERVQRRRNDMLSLLALGYGFQVRLAGQVAVAHEGRGVQLVQQLQCRRIKLPALKRLKLDALFGDPSPFTVSLLALVG